MTTREFPRNGFLILGVLSIAACLIFVVRSVGVEATSERVWSAVAFGAMGILWLWAYWSSRHD
jgi:4-amino-4-deoxy-L-arabinose transferase-like glycosyltransferase